MNDELTVCTKISNSELRTIAEKADTVFVCGRVCKNRWGYADFPPEQAKMPKLAYAYQDNDTKSLSVISADAYWHDGSILFIDGDRCDVLFINTDDSPFILLRNTESEIFIKTLRIVSSSHFLPLINPTFPIVQLPNLNGRFYPAKFYNSGFYANEWLDSTAGLEKSKIKE